MPLAGTCTVNDQAVAADELLYVAAGRSELSIGASLRAHVLVIGGRPLDEPVLIWWNFVARTQDELEAAALQWNGGDARFGAVVGGAAARIPAPDTRGLRLRSGGA